MGRKGRICGTYADSMAHYTAVCREEIQRRKYLISQGIIHILSTQRLQQKTCGACKRNLPWNWPYRLCDACYHRQRFQGGRGRSGRDGDAFRWEE